MPCFYRVKNMQQKSESELTSTCGTSKNDNAKKSSVDCLRLWASPGLPCCILQGLYLGPGRKFTPKSSTFDKIPLTESQIMSEMKGIWVTWNHAQFRWARISRDWYSLTINIPYQVLVAVCRPKWSQTAKELRLRNVLSRSRCCGPNKAMEVLKTSDFRRFTGCF